MLGTTRCFRGVSSLCKHWCQLCLKIEASVDSVAEKALTSLQLKFPRLQPQRTSISSLSELIEIDRTYLHLV